MQAVGCGFPAAHFLSSFSIASAQLNLDDARIPMGTSYGQSALSFHDTTLHRLGFYMLTVLWVAPAIKTNMGTIFI